MRLYNKLGGEHPDEEWLVNPALPTSRYYLGALLWGWLFARAGILRGSGSYSAFEEDFGRRSQKKMIPYMDLNEQADSDFTRARRRALLRRVLARLSRKKPASSNQLLCFDELRTVLQANNRRYLGRRVVEVEKIIGSVGRCAEFDGSFLPLKASLAHRWKRIDRAFHRGEELPAVELYKMGDLYFVLDGHHRVSVARYHDVPAVEAEVIEFHPKKLPAAAPLAEVRRELATTCRS
jgi:hypothetical protein